jgi:hypothetical protein
VAALAAVRPLGLTVVLGSAHPEPAPVPAAPVGSGASVSPPAPVRPPRLVVPPNVPLPSPGPGGSVTAPPRFYFAEGTSRRPRPDDDVPRPVPGPRRYREGPASGVVGTSSGGTGFVYWYMP